jgi:IMP dehydrogenase
MAKINDKTYYTFNDVLLQPQYSEIPSRSDVDTMVEIVPGIKLSSPLIAANMAIIISPELCIKLWECGGIGIIHQFQSIEKEVSMLKEVKEHNAKVITAIGASTDFMERAEALIENGTDAILMDTPHAHSKNMLDAVDKFRKKFPNIPLIGGTVATKDGAKDLYNSGIDCLKYGVGAGHACLTRVNAGTGVPQLSAVMDAYEVAKQMGKTIISDGGINNPGDFSKAIAAGASAIQSGRIFAGTFESFSEIVEKDGKKYKIYRGDSSIEAKQDRVKNDPNYKRGIDKYIEGTQGLVLLEGPLEDVVSKYVMGLRSSMSYSGAWNINEFHDKAVFLPITVNGSTENGAHNWHK